MLISIPLILIFAFHFNVFLSATDSSQHIAPHTHLTLSQETAPPPIQKTNTPSTSISFSSPHSTSLALKQYQKDSLEVQSITWNEIQAICYNKTPDQLFNNFSYYANPYYLDLIRQKHGYEDFILNLHQRYTDDHDYRKSLRCIKGFYPYEFLKLIDTECDRIKTIQFEREQQKQLQLQKKLEATKHHCLQINNSSKYQNFIKQCEQDTYNAQILGNQNLINRYQKRIAAAQNALANPTLYDYSSHLKTYPVWNDPDAAVFNHRIGTALDQQLHEELCNTRLRMHELSFNTSTLEYKQHYAPIVYRCTALAKQEKNISIAFGLSDFSDAVVRILSRGIQFISHVSSGPIKGLKMIAQDVSSSKYWTELVTAMPNFIINVLPILLAHSPQLLKQGIIFAAHEQSFWDSLDQAYMRGDHELLEKQCKTYAEESRQQLKPIDDRFKQLASMSWEDIGKYGTYYGGRLILDAMACRAFTLAASTAGRELTCKIATLLESSTTPERLADVAGIGKIAIEEGVEATCKAIQIIQENPILSMHQAQEINKLLKAGNALDKGNLTCVGRAFQKHGSRSPTIYPKATGNPAAINTQGEAILKEILTHPTVQRQERHHASLGFILEYKIPGDKGARFTGDGKSFIGFLEPNHPI